MRQLPLFLAILLLTISGGQVSAESDGDGSSGGREPSASGQADRQLSRQMRRQRRVEQLDTLRRRHGHTDRLPPHDHGPRFTILPVDPPEVCPPHDDIHPHPHPHPHLYPLPYPILIGPPIVIDPDEPIEPAALTIWEGFPNEDGEYDNGEWDWYCPPPHDHHPIQKLDDDSLTFLSNRASDDGDRGRMGNGPRDGFPFLDQVRDFLSGRDNDRGDVVPDPRANRDRNIDPERADRILARRLAEIDHLRDAALANGSVKLLDEADLLEELARAQHARRTDSGVDPATAQVP